MLDKSTTILKVMKVGSKFVRLTHEGDAEDNKEIGVCQDFYMPKGYYEDFGSPNTFTVTVEPGDLLNSGGVKVPAKKKGVKSAAKA